MTQRDGASDTDDTGREEAPTGDRARNVFVMGLDDKHLANIRTIPDIERFAIHALLEADEVVYQDNYEIEARLDKARRILDEFDGPVDAIIGHWDFPVTSMVPILCRERGLISPSLESVLKCAHKYWSRLEQQRAVPDLTPAFCAVDPFADDPWSQVELEPPFWIKPVKGYASVLGFRVEGRKDFDRAIALARKHIRRCGDPFNVLLGHADLPPEIEEVDGNHMVVEELMGGLEIAPEGFVQRGGFHVHGMIDMVRGPNHKSFLRYEYPSQAPEAVQERAVDAAQRVLEGMGFDDGCFNMEFFWDPEEDDLRVIEINPRISQSHCGIFELVHGMSNHEVAIQVALGNEPRFGEEAGPFDHAAKFLHRQYDPTDALVTRAPTDEDLAALEKAQPHTRVNVAVREGMRLSELMDQDPYSHCIAELIIGGDSREDLVRKYREATGLLPFGFAPIGDDRSRRDGEREGGDDDPEAA